MRETAREYSAQQEHSSPEADLSLPSVSPEGPLYRVGRKPDPWLLPDWAYAHDDGTFGNRFDDSEGYFRVSYASSTKLGCFVETLARFRRPPKSTLVAQRLEEIANSSSDSTAPGTLPKSWLTTRALGTGTVAGGRFVPIYSSEWLSHLRREFEAELESSTLSQSNDADFDLHLLMSRNRSLTQRFASAIYAMGYNGICYESRHGTDLVNWALFEPLQISSPEISALSLEDHDFQEAIKRLDLRVSSQT